MHQQAIEYAFRQLKTKLSPNLAYHSLWHTEEDVLPSCRRMADTMGIEGQSRALLEVAAAFHDIGFIVGHREHEKTGVGIAAQILPTFGFSDHDITMITGMIMATRLPQHPNNILEAIIADADLDVLGRPDFLTRNMCLWQELANFGNEIELQAWYKSQIAFIENHRYFTQAAQQFRGPFKQENIEILQEKLDTLDI